MLDVCSSDSRLLSVAVRGRSSRPLEVAGCGESLSALLTEAGCGESLGARMPIGASRYFRTPYLWDGFRREGPDEVSWASMDKASGASCPSPSLDISIWLVQASDRDSLTAGRLCPPD